MNNSGRLLMLVLVSLFIVGCSAPKKAEEREVKIGSIFSLLGDAFPGGIFLRLEGANGSLIEKRFDAEPYNLQIPNGQWTFHIVAFAGPASYVGEAKCASSAPIDLKAEDTVVNLDVDTDCTATHHVSMMKVNPVWEQGHWDNTTWAP